MTLIQQADPLAFDELYLRYKKPVYSYFLGLLNNSVAEEILQETFLKILIKKNTFRFESKVKTWIWVIARNTLLDYWRSLDHKMENSFDTIYTSTGEENFESQLDDLETSLLKKIDSNQLKICIEELPKDQQEIVFLHIQSELSNQEISDILIIGIGAIKSVLFRTKEKLITCFKRGGHL
ncbi:MAG: RNA polymerase sigma factor [Bacteriovorax sp.]|nr:RNA polymerase sigma factor [Bacteriovorax sp.]